MMYLFLQSGYLTLNTLKMIIKNPNNEMRLDFIKAIICLGYSKYT